MPGILQVGDPWDGVTSSGSGEPTGSSDTPVTFSDPVTPETATLQMLLSEGQIGGLVDGLKSVYLDNTPIQNSDGSFNFKGIAVAMVAGTNTQAAVKGITGAENPVAVNVQATYGAPVTRTISSGPSAIRLRVSIPQFKIVDTATGNSKGTTVQVKVERQNASYNGGAWEPVPLETNGQIGGGPFSTKFTKSYRIDLPPSASPWQVRLSRLSADDADAYHMSQTWWEDYTEIVDARMRYPNSAVLSLRLNGKQFRSIPKVSCDLYGVQIQVPTNYTPATQDPATGLWTAGVYATSGPGTTAGAWDGTFKTAWSCNPAWGFYDAAVKTRYGCGNFLSASGLDKWTLYSIAQWCDAMVADGKGGSEPRMTCNLYLQNSVNAIKALGQLASIFWGAVFYAAGMVTPVADTDADPSALFTNANVIDGRFSYEGTARTARHTAAIATFINPELGWAADTAVYEDVDGIARYGYNPLDLAALGATSQGQALRMAKWAILTELLAAETISFATGLEGSSCVPGDVIQVIDQHRAGSAREGGRFKAGSTTTSLVLDAAVTIGAGTYYLKFRNSAGVVESRVVSTPAGTASVLTVGVAFSVAPPAGAVWVLQEGSAASLWRVISIRKSDGLAHEVTALKHDPEKYALLNLSTGEVIPRPGSTPTTPAPAGLNAICTQRILDDRQVLTIEASWTLDEALSYVAEASRDYGSWQPMAVSGASATLEGCAPGSWRVRVSGVWRAGQSPAAETALVVSSSTTPPGFVDGVKKGDIATPNYVPGTHTTMATGAKMAAVPFSADLMDGTTISAQAEFGGDIVIAGRKAAVVVDRVFGSSTEWTTPGTYTWVCPEGINNPELTLQAPGGRGASGCGQGGDGGQYIRRRYSLIPGATYTIVVPAVGSDVTITGPSFSVTAFHGADGGAGSMSGANGASNDVFESPENGWSVPGGKGGEGSTAGSGIKSGDGGSAAKTPGGAGVMPTATRDAGGGGGASGMAPGGHGDLSNASGQDGTLGSGGGGGLTGGQGGPAYVRIRY